MVPKGEFMGSNFGSITGLFSFITIPPPPGGTAILPEYIHYYGYYLLSSNSAVLINIITGVSPPHFDFVVYYVLCQC
jgi:hypothetical protein